MSQFLSSSLSKKYQNGIINNLPKEDGPFPTQRQCPPGLRTVEVRFALNARHHAKCKQCAPQLRRCRIHFVLQCCFAWLPFEHSTMFKGVGVVFNAFASTMLHMFSYAIHSSDLCDLPDSVYRLFFSRACVPQDLNTVELDRLLS